MRNKKLTILLFLIFFASILLYAAYTARHIILGPRLELDVPGGIMTVTTQVIEIAGSAQNTTELRLNNNKLLLSEDGSFNEQMLLSVGVNTFIFDVQDKFGRSSQKELQIIYTPTEDGVLQLKDITNAASE